MIRDLTADSNICTSSGGISAVILSGGGGGGKWGVMGGEREGD